MSFGPPMSSSESDDEFVFSSDFDAAGNKIKPKKHYIYNNQNKDGGDRENDYSTEMISVIRQGNIDEFQAIRMKSKITDINKPIPKQLWNPLMYACHERNAPLVQHFLCELNANPNQYSTDSPLILACQGILVYDQPATEFIQTEEKVLAIVHALIDHGAIINMSNGYGETALMFAAQNGYTNVVKLFLNNNVSIEACDNKKRTAIFYAVEGNKCEVVKQLIEAGAMVDVQDRFQDTPKLIARACGYVDIEDLFGIDDNKLTVPAEYRSYNSYEDLIPTAFSRNATPYSPDINAFLIGAQMDDIEYSLYTAQIGLPDLLSCNDEQLKQYGIAFPFQRKRILHALVRFHLRAWSKNSMVMPKKGSSSNLEFFDFYANCLKQLVVIKSAIIFYQRNDFLNDMNDVHIRAIHSQLHRIYQNVERHVALMSSVDAHCSDIPALLIDHEITGNTFHVMTTRMKLIAGFACAIGIGLGYKCFKAIRSF